MSKTITYDMAKLGKFLMGREEGENAYYVLRRDIFDTLKPDECENLPLLEKQSGIPHLPMRPSPDVGENIPTKYSLIKMSDTESRNFRNHRVDYGIIDRVYITLAPAS